MLVHMCIFIEKNLRKQRNFNSYCVEVVILWMIFMFFFISSSLLEYFKNEFVAFHTQKKKIK